MTTRCLYYALSYEVVVGDETPWGVVTGAYLSRGYLHLTTACEDGECLDHIPVNSRVPVLRTRN